MQNYRRMGTENVALYQTHAHSSTHSEDSGASKESGEDTLTENTDASNSNLPTRELIEVEDGLWLAAETRVDASTGSVTR